MAAIQLIFVFINNIYPESIRQSLRAQTPFPKSYKRNLSTTIQPKKIKASRIDVNHSTYWWKRTQFVSFWKQLNFFHFFSNWFYVNQLTPLWKATQPFFSSIQYGNPLWTVYINQVNNQAKAYSLQNCLERTCKNKGSAGGQKRITKLLNAP